MALILTRTVAKLAKPTLFSNTTLRTAGRMSADKFNEHQLTKDLELRAAPEQLMTVKYSNGCEVHLGNELTPTQVYTIFSSKCRKGGGGEGSLW